MNREIHSTRLKTQNKKSDYWLLAATLTLLLTGLVVIYDASVVTAFRDFGNKYYFVKNQAIWAVLGLTSLTFFSFLDYHRLLKYSRYFLIASIVALVMVLIPHIGTQVLGARRWINIGSFTFQPSEFAKLAVVFYATYIIAKFQNYKMNIFDTFIVYFLPILIVTALVVVQPDLGTALIFFAIIVAIYFIGNAPIWHFLLTIPLVVLASIVALFTHPYRLERIKAFMDPTYDPQGASYQINQIIIALSSGGMFGVGVGSSRSKFEFIPEVHSDAIFAVVAEELGFVGAILLIALFIFLITRAIKIAKEAADYEGKVLAAGLSGLLAVQILLNLAAIVALIPLTGIPLPFISYGGSSLFISLTTIGMLTNIKRQS